MSKTANHAKPGKPNRKAMARLQARITDFIAMKSSTKHESKVAQRIESGGYRCPGSMK